MDGWTFWARDKQVFRQKRIAAKPSEHSVSAEGSGTTMGPWMFPDPVAPSNKVTPKVLAPGETELSKMKPDSGVEVNTALFSINDTNPENRIIGCCESRGTARRRQAGNVNPWRNVYVEDGQQTSAIRNSVVRIETTGQLR